MRHILPVLALLAACRTPPEPEPDPGAVWPGRPRSTGRIDTDWLADVQIPAGGKRLGRENEAFVAGACHVLDRDDFADYSSSAAGLVALGEPVVPYLGRYAEPPTRDERLFAIVSVVLEPILMKVDPEPLGSYLDSPYRAVRATAARVVGERNLTEHAYRLVGLLEDEHVEVRRDAIRALRRISNRFQGYRPDGAPDERAVAVKRWRRLWGTG